MTDYTLAICQHSKKSKNAPGQERLKTGFTQKKEQCSRKRNKELYMAKQGFYGREYVKTKTGGYDYQAQVNRLHNLKQWDRDETLTIKESSTISLDEMNERWKAYDWLIADDKHFESKIIKKVDELRSIEKHKEEKLIKKYAYSKELNFSFLKKYF